MRQLLVPIRDEDEEDVIQEVSDALALSGVPVADQAQVLAEELEIWRSEGQPPPRFAEAVVVALAASSSTWIRRLAPHYFDLHRQLQERLGMTFEAATGCIALVDLTAELAVRHRMSSAQVAVHLQARGPTSDFPWRAHQLVLSKIGASPELSDADLEEILEWDRRAEEGVFVDASWLEANEVAAHRARAAGLPEETQDDLRRLAPSDGSIHWPYLHMLHYSLLPLGKLDHAPTFVYEFSPRREWAKSTFGAIYKSLTGTAENPILNNAKSVDRLGPWWADSKWRSAGHASRAKARALVGLLQSIESLPAPAKRDYASVIRAWCLRMVRLFGSEPAPLPGPPDADQVAVLMRGIAARNTSTRGVLEQRLVDVIAASVHTDDRWRPRGLLDSVNAANLPRRKLGDCEFQDSSSRQVVAYEAHGGILSDVYARGHLAGLQRIVKARIDEEWGTGAGWHVLVRFVAHGFSATPPDPFRIDDVDVEIEFISFDAFVEGINPAEILEEVEELLWLPLNQPRTPESVRDKYRELLSGAE